MRKFSGATKNPLPGSNGVFVGRAEIVRQFAALRRDREQNQGTRSRTAHGGRTCVGFFSLFHFLST